MSEVLSLPGYGKSDSFRRLEGAVWKTVMEFLAKEIAVKTVVGGLTGAGAGAAVAGGVAALSNAFFKTDFNVKKAAIIGAKGGGGLTIVLSLTEVNWQGMIAKLGEAQVLGAVGEKARDKQRERTVELQLKDFDCNLNSSRAEFERKYREKIAECDKQDSGTASVNKKIYDAAAADIRKWFDSRGMHH